MNPSPANIELEAIKLYTRICDGHPALLKVWDPVPLRKKGKKMLGYRMEIADDRVTGMPPLDPHQPYQSKNLRTEVSDKVRFALREGLEVALALASGLAFLHEHGLVHRDIKPENIMYVSGMVKIGDISLVTYAHPTSRSDCGTEGYRPPEGHGDKQGDIYSLGKVLYEMFTGNDVKKFPELPGDWADVFGTRHARMLNQIILTACEEDTENRYRSARDLSLALARLGKAK